MHSHEVEKIALAIERSLRAVAQVVEASRSELQASASAAAEALGDEVDSAKGSEDLAAAVAIHNRSFARQCRLENALIRITNGTFGICRSCGDDIDILRLEARPECERCIDCQSRIEHCFGLASSRRAALRPATRSQS